MATAVISASEGMHYPWYYSCHRYNNYNSYCISGFTGLAILGIGESAFVAVIIL
jgi:hypothetical protein